MPLLASAQSREGGQLALAFEHMAAGDWSAAREAALLGGPVAADVIDWHWLRAGLGSFADYQDFLTRNADWPGLPLLQERGEPSIPAGADPAAVIAFFEHFPVETGIGALRLSAAYEARGMSGDAEVTAVLAWRTLSLSAEEQQSLLVRYAPILADHHAARLDMLLWAQRFEEAARMEPLVEADWLALAAARRGLAQDETGVDDLIAAVPEALADHPGLAFERMQWRARKGREDGAVTLLLAQSSSVEALGDPAAWGGRRRALAREMMRDGKPAIAYRLAARHLLIEGDDYADLEWLAGYIALRYLDDPALAYGHFQTFRAAVASPISLGRAGYWEGRALEAMGALEEARAAYVYGARFQTSFYGLLAAERVGLPMDPALLGEEVFPDYREAAFMQSSVLRAAILLHEARQLPLSARFMRHLGESLSDVELGQLADLALDLDEPYLAVLVAKFAAGRGVVLPRAYYPLADLGKGELAVDRALALSIARRESEFNPGAVSHAGARGLMQLMPRTGEAMAEVVGEDFELDRLLTDPGFNATLGSAYLARLIDEYGPAMALVAAGYNAGPHRVENWIERFGDPRSGAVDPVDWVEHIPFRETRNYVMRVAESLPVYRARLAGELQPITLIKDLTGR